MKRDRIAQWVRRIATSWRDSVGGILKTSNLLVQAHEKLKDERGEWAKLTGRNEHPQQLPFTWSIAEKLKLIGEDPRLVALGQQLPPDWRCIYELTTLKGNDFRRFIRTGKVTPGMQRVEVRKFKRMLRMEREQAAAITIVPKATIHLCAIQDVGPDLLPDACGNAILTDPPYPEKYLDTFSMLAEFADRVLKPSGWCVVMTGTIFLPEVISRLAAKLTYRWQYVVTTPGGNHARISSVGLFQNYKPVLLFQKPPICKIREWWPDVIIAKAAEQDKSLHPWQQNETVFSELVNRFSRPGDLIIDPFAGSGTTGRAAEKQGRHFWGCDSDAEYAVAAE